MSTPTIPEPRLRMVKNQTPFELFQCDKMGVGRKFYDTVVVKGTFHLTPQRIGLAEVQAPIALADELWDPDHADRSSLKHAGEVVLTKPSTDVIVTGTARAPGGEPLREWTAAIEIQDRNGLGFAYRAQALGPRHWRHTAADGWDLMAPEPTREVPIRYELSYGGAYPAAPPRASEAAAVDAAGEPEPEAAPSWVVHAPNPSGTGFFDERALDTAVDYPAPQWQPHGAPVTAMNCEIPLAGFGPVARPWRSRLQYAGTYDEAWIRATREEIAQGLPADYARDFDPRFFQCAHPELVTPKPLEGSEMITLTGLMPGEGPYTLQLPCVRVIASLLDGKEDTHAEELRLDTVHLDLDAETVSLCWRLTLDQERDIRAAVIELTEIA